MYKEGKTERPPTEAEKRTGMYAQLLDAAVAQGGITTPSADKGKIIALRSSINRFRKTARNSPDFNNDWDLVTNHLVETSPEQWAIRMEYDKVFRDRDRDWETC